MAKEGKYRRGVGVMLLNADKQVWVGRRIDNTDEAWQMPQGGMDEGEQPWETALRELEEETGIPPHLVERIADHPERLRYDLPDELRPKLWGRQMEGPGAGLVPVPLPWPSVGIDIDTEHPEFCDWKWVSPHTLPDLIVPFKRDLYRCLVDHWAGFLGR